MVTATIKDLKIHKIRCENFMKLTLFEASPNGNHLLLRGPNASGKTSCMEAIWTALRGSSVKEIPEPIHKGQDKASVTLDLGEYKVTRRWTKSGSSLDVRASDGSKINRAQELLNTFCSDIMLDPLAFLTLRPQDQVDAVLNLCEIKPPVEGVERLTGDKQPPLPGESADQYLMRLSQDETGIYYVRRREANRHCDQKRKALEEARAELENVGTVGDEPRSTSDLLGEIDRLNGAAHERMLAQENARAARLEAKDKTAKLERLKVDRAREAEQALEIEWQIEVLQKRLAEHRGLERELCDRIGRGSEICSQLDARATGLEAAAAALEDPAPKIGTLRREITAIELTNLERQKRQVFKMSADRLAAEVEESQAEHKRFDDALAGIRDMRIHLLDGHELGIDGLQVGQGELRLNDVSFRQASLAQRLRVACAIAMKNPKPLKLLRIDNAEHLDSDSQRLLQELADERDYQLIEARVEDVDGLRFEVVEAK